MENSQPAYVYSKLLYDGNIRLLKLQGNSDKNSILKFSLVEVSLEIPPKFYSISYCWENQVPSKKVLCDGKSLLVTVNCEAALRQYRKSDGESLTIWIDAICINQSAKAGAERNHQVTMMGEIYNKAEEVWVWLGISELDHLNDRYVRVLECFRELAEDALNYEGRDHERHMDMIAQKLSIRDLSEIVWQIPWFRRLWVVQEVALARSCILFHDDIAIDYRGLCKALSILAYSRDNRTYQIYNILEFCFNLFYRATNILLDAREGREINVERLLFAARAYETQDPKDRVFGLYCLLEAIGLKLPEPDYAKPTEQIHQEIAVIVCSTSNTITILHQVDGLSDENISPSWTPRWHTSRHPTLPHSARRQRYEVCGLAKPVFSFQNNNKWLSVQGKIIDTIASCPELGYPHCYEKQGAPKDYFKWSHNSQPNDPKWIEYMKTHPCTHRELLDLWGIRILQNFVKFALGSD